MTEFNRTTASKIDWQYLREQLDWDNEAQRQQRTIERLRQRAVQYAAQAAEAEFEAVEDALSVLTFHLGKEHYALEVQHVRAVRAANNITRVPGTPSFYRGVVNLRGQVITLLDLRRFLDLNVDTNQIPPEMILIETHGLEIGVLADHVQDVITMPRSSLDHVEMRYLLGIRASTRLTVLDIEQLFTDERLKPEGIDES